MTRTWSVVCCFNHVIFIFFVVVYFDISFITERDLDKCRRKEEGVGYTDIDENT